METYLGLDPIFDAELLSPIMETGESRRNENSTRGVRNKLSLKNEESSISLDCCIGNKRCHFVWLGISVLAITFVESDESAANLHQNSMHSQSATRRYRFQSSLQGLDRCTYPRDDLTHDPRPAKSKGLQAQTEL